jgi:dUTP pyrophosphatase
MDVQLLSADARVPERKTPGAAGFDLFCSEACVLPPRGRSLVKTDIAVALPPGTYGRVAPRSGLGVKGIDVGAGVIDEDYRGEVKVLLVNATDAEVPVARGDRIAQLIITRILHCPVRTVGALDDTERGSGGFGSTGV